MPSIQCNSCKGVYPDTTQPGLIPYFHVCPDKIVKTPEIFVPGTGITQPVAFQPTPNPRNENLMPDPQNPGKYVMISAGSGVTSLP